MHKYTIIPPLPLPDTLRSLVLFFNKRKKIQKLNIFWWTSKSVTIYNNYKPFRVININIVSISLTFQFWFCSFSLSNFVSLPSELQGIHGVRPAQHFVTDRSDWEPGCKRCAGMSFLFFLLPNPGKSDVSNKSCQWRSLSELQKHNYFSHIWPYLHM